MKKYHGIVSNDERNGTKYNFIYVILHNWNNFVVLSCLETVTPIICYHILTPGIFLQTENSLCGPLLQHLRADSRRRRFSGEKRARTSLFLPKVVASINDVHPDVWGCVTSILHFRSRCGWNEEPNVADIIYGAPLSKLPAATAETTALLDVSGNVTLGTEKSSVRYQSSEILYSAKCILKRLGESHLSRSSS